jgi:hypothetical protein
MKSCLECEEKIIGREDKSFVATVVVMPTTIKSIKIVLILCATLTTSCAKLSHSIGSNRWKSKPPELNYLAKDLTLSFYQYFTNQNR